MSDSPLVAPPVAGPSAPPPPNTLADLDPEARRRRRRKWLLLLLLGVLATVFLVIGTWYLLFRKPLDEILPPVMTEKAPQFSFSIYDLDHPIGVAVTPDGGRIYVSDSAGARVVHVYDSRAHQIGTLVPPGTSPGSRIPVYIAIDPVTSQVYVSDRWSASIEIYGSDNAYIGTFKPDPAIPDWQPLGLAFDAAGRLYVGDVAGTSHRVLVFDRDRKLVRTVGVAQNLEFPNGLAIDAHGDIAIADGNNGRVLIIGPDDGVVGSIGRGFAPGELALPRGMAIDDSGRLYVTDTTAHVVQMYRLDAGTGAPTWIAAVGSEGRDEGSFEYPHGLAVDGRARIYIADWANNRLDVWSY
jgi:DNA-binding beta-propeller fold protein YncE